MLMRNVPLAHWYVGGTALLQLPLGLQGGVHAPQLLMRASRSAALTMPSPSGDGAMSAAQLPEPPSAPPPPPPPEMPPPPRSSAPPAAGPRMSRPQIRPAAKTPVSLNVRIEYSPLDASALVRYVSGEVALPSCKLYAQRQASGGQHSGI